MLIGTHSESQRSIYVPTEYTTIQSALNIATSGDTVIVHPGIYYENIVWPNRDNIKLIAMGSIDETIIDGSALDRVVTIEPSGPGPDGLQKITKNTMIKGFTLQNGVNSDIYYTGAGILTREASPSLINLKIKDNHGNGDLVRGGGANLQKFNGIIENCEFIGNTLNSDDSRTEGAGLYVRVKDSLVILNCRFIENVNTCNNYSLGAGLYIHDGLVGDGIVINISGTTFERNSSISPERTSGGGAYIFAREVSELILNSCIFEGNTSGECYSSYGGGLMAWVNKMSINNCQFIENSAVRGAAIELISNTDTTNLNIKGSYFSGNFLLPNINPERPHVGSVFSCSMSDPAIVLFENCVIDHNVGNTINMYRHCTNPGERHGQIQFSHCTFAYNEGFVYSSSSTVKASNCVFWENGEFDFMDDERYDSHFDITNCIVQEFKPEFNISSDPLFEGEFNLKPRGKSPCISAAANSSVDLDIEGNPRPLPTGSLPDLGAYEIDQTTSNHNIQDTSNIIYPNPTQDYIIVSLGSTCKATSFSIYNRIGKIVSTQYNIGSYNMVDISDFQPGIYYVQYNCNNSIAKLGVFTVY